MPPLEDPAQLDLPALKLPACRDFLLEALNQRWQIGPQDIARLDALAAEIRARGEASGGGQTIVCAAVHHGNFPTLQYLAHGLRARGQRTLGVYLMSTPPADTFDWSYACDGSLARFCYLLRQLARGSVYLQAHARWCFLGQLVQAVAPALAVYQEVYDWMELFVEREHEPAFLEAGWFSESELALIRQAETHVRTGLDGFVYKGCRTTMAGLLGEATVPSVQIVPCPPRSWQRPPAPPPAGPWKLVHAGQIKSQAASRAIFGDLHYLPVIHTLTTQGCEVTAYASAAPDRDTFQRLYGDYLDEAARNPRFALEPHLPVRDLIRALNGRFHFGLLIYQLDDDLKVGRPHLRAALASKLFSYLAAGLPVLVSRELEYMAELVERHGCGIVVDRNDFGRIGELLAAVDYGELQAAVLRAQELFHIERYVPPILDLLTRGAVKA